MLAPTIEECKEHVIIDLVKGTGYATSLASLQRANTAATSTLKTSLGLARSTVELALFWTVYLLIHTAATSLGFRVIAHSLLYLCTGSVVPHVRRSVMNHTGGHDGTYDNHDRPTIRAYPLQQIILGTKADPTTIKNVRHKRRRLGARSKGSKRGAEIRNLGGSRRAGSASQARKAKMNFTEKAYKAEVRRQVQKRAVTITKPPLEVEKSEDSKNEVIPAVHELEARRNVCALFTDADQIAVIATA
ncbi:hypothetical protein EKO27_g26 [Xylaria grammica]|uniref:Uncharacterized protein n=1 Tax=Xylaria grammica TaxID=363999 RepID=A0A439DKN6_9PEZI|nr:hypothetical protein EKO27_g26 [Xylaria grammica]